MWIFLTIFFAVLFILALGYALIERESRKKKEKELMQLTIKMRDIMRKRTMTRETQVEENDPDDNDNMDCGPVIYRTIVPSTPSIPAPAPVSAPASVPASASAAKPEQVPESEPAPISHKPGSSFNTGLLFPEEEESVLFPTMAEQPKEKRRSSIQYRKIDHAFIEKAKSIVARQMSDPSFGVEELSEIMGMSRVHLARKFKENTDMTPNALIKNTRIDEATKLLMENNSNMYEIAKKCGFASASYFSTSFKSVYGITPKEFVSQYGGISLEDALKKKIQ